MLASTPLQEGTTVVLEQLPMFTLHPHENQVAFQTTSKHDFVMVARLLQCMSIPVGDAAEYTSTNVKRLDLEAPPGLKTEIMDGVKYTSSRNSGVHIIPVPPSSDRVFAPAPADYLSIMGGTNVRDLVSRGCIAPLQRPVLSYLAITKLLNVSWMWNTEWGYEIRMDALWSATAYITMFVLWCHLEYMDLWTNELFALSCILVLGVPVVWMLDITTRGVAMAVFHVYWRCGRCRRVVDIHAQNSGLDVMLTTLFRAVVWTVVATWTMEVLYNGKLSTHGRAVWPLLAYCCAVVFVSTMFTVMSVRCCSRNPICQ